MSDMTGEITADSELVADAVCPVIENPKHQVFADEFLRIGNATQAAIVAGYSERTAGTQAAQIRAKPDVAAYIAFKRLQSSRDAEFSRTRWLKELGNLAFSNVQDLTSLDKDGNLRPDFTNATREQLSAVSAVKYKKRNILDRQGNVVAEEVESEFKLWDKLRATEQLGKHAGLLREPDQKIIVDVADRLLTARARTIEQLRVSAPEAEEAEFTELGDASD